ncbi:redoxin family protein [Candidatus Viadribacter manganicus]|uniref:redoxin family protein n=1 Tax=Candidatus Viadribacter manganicus TaxID=1759059 RepID=UPI000AAE23D2|nr:redoxin family protein [Candidatus Viadribacter manganicus]
MLSKRDVLLGGAALVTLAACGGPPADLQHVASGAQAPAFSVTDATGAVRTLAEFAGQNVILEWTNEGCPYVRKHYETGNMQAVQREAAQRGWTWLQVISSAPGQQGHLDGPGALARVQADQATVTATLLDGDGVMGRAYGALSTPQMVMINGEGQIIYQGAIDDRASARPETLEGATNYVRAAWADLDAGRPVQIAQTTPYGCSVKYAA